MSSSGSDMSGKVCLVTGATSGIGAATALALARLGATVILAGRDQARCAAQVEAIRENTGNEQVEALLADLSVQISSKRSRILSRSRKA